MPTDEYADGAGQSRLIGRGRQIAEELETLAPDKTLGDANDPAHPRRR
jgi:hypothetical protein